MDEGIRTPNTQIHSPGDPSTKQHAEEDLWQSNELLGEKVRPDPDLQCVIAAWPDLPDPIRRAILALIGSAGS